MKSNHSNDSFPIKDFDYQLLATGNFKKLALRTYGSLSKRSATFRFSNFLIAGFTKPACPNYASVMRRLLGRLKKETILKL